MNRSDLANRNQIGRAFGMLLALSIGVQCPGLAAQPDTWSITKSLKDVRFWHAAALLKTGKVLVSGGIDGNYNVTATAEIYDPVSGVWASTGPMHFAREFHSLVLLKNGNVLAVGGSDSNFNAVAQAELYDPASGVWTVTGFLNAARVFNAATPLANGDVLVSGGVPCEYCYTPLNSAEMYNPASGTWSLTGGLLQARSQHTMTLLKDGRVLAAAGCAGFYCTPLDSAELYSPVSGTWAATGIMHGVRSNASANLLSSGHVLVAGGFGSGGGPIATVESFDPGTGAWSVAEGLTTPRSDQIASVLPDGRIMQSGGVTPGGYSTGDTELYQPSLGLWTTVGPMVVPVYGAAGVVLANGAVLVTGGVNFNGVATSQIFSEGASSLLSIFPANPDFGSPLIGTNSLPQIVSATNTGSRSLTITAVTVGGNGFSESDNCAGTTLAPGAKCSVTAVYRPTIVGAQSAGLVFQDNAPGGGQGVTLSGIGTDRHWQPRSRMTYARAFHTASLLQTGKVLITGGGCSGNSLSYSLPFLTELYAPFTGQFTLSGPLNDPRGSHTATVLNDGRVLAAGGCNGSVILSSAEVYDPGTGNWTLTGSMSTNRLSHTATLLASGKVLVAGGGTASAELYDPSTGSWSGTGSMHVSRTAHTATLLPNGNVLVAGGGLNTAEIYNPLSGTWKLTGAMSTDRSGHTMTLLSTGQVLVAGGSGSGQPFLASAEIYDPGAGSWSTTGSMKQPRTGHAAALLLLGNVLVEGGENYCDPEFELCFDTASAESYNPSNGQWVLLSPMTTSRVNQTATLLSRGNVLVTGGDGEGLLGGGTDQGDSTELFEP